MKNTFVKDFVADQTITNFFLVHEKEIRNSAAGKAYLRMELGDRSGTVESRMWDQFETCAKEVRRDDFVKVQGRVEVYRNRFQLILQQFRLAKPEEIELGDYLPHTPYNVDVFVPAAPWLHRRTEKSLAEAARHFHFQRSATCRPLQARPRRQSHASRLSWRTSRARRQLCGLAKQIAAHYPELDVDLLLTAALLHHVGKLDELCYERAVGYTTEGQLLGHIIMELDTVTKAMDAIAGFPHKLKTVVQHILISHHGEYEFGSPKLPMIREALVFHFMDDLDSKVAAVRAALAIPSTEDDWSAYSGALGRKFLRLPDFLKDKAPDPEPPPK